MGLNQKKPQQQHERGKEAKTKRSLDTRTTGIIPGPGQVSFDTGRSEMMMHIEEEKMHGVKGKEDEVFLSAVSVACFCACLLCLLSLCLLYLLSFFLEYQLLLLNLLLFWSLPSSTSSCQYFVLSSVSFSSRLDP